MSDERGFIGLKKSGKEAKDGWLGFRGQGLGLGFRDGGLGFIILRYEMDTTA